MNMLKTKDVSEKLGVSQTTIKRWASHFTTAFQKDSNGHYIFSEKEVILLQYIKDQVDRGAALDHIRLPGSPPPKIVRQSEIANRPADEMLDRIREVERSLSQKADEVVSAQVYQHRAELDELRQMIAQLAVTVETIQEMRAKPVAPYEDFRLPITIKAPTPARKRGFFRSFF